MFTKAKRRKIEINSVDLCEAKRVKMKLSIKKDGAWEEYPISSFSIMRAELTSEDTETVFFSKREIISEPKITTTVIQSEGYYRAHQKMDSTPSSRTYLFLMTRQAQTKKDG